jgi:hypothetical protein
MNSARYVLGVDPGETTGIVRLKYERKDTLWLPIGAPLMLQCNHQSVPEILAWVAAIGDILISHERFVVGLRASRSKKAGASQITRDINGHIDALDKTDAPNRRIRVVEHTAAETKPWATDERLKAAGIDLAPEMRHARDGGRQALFAACKDLGATDPLSKRARLAEAYSGGGVHPLAESVTGPNGEPLFFPGTSPTGRLQRSPLPYPQDVMRRVSDSQTGDEARYIGINYFTQGSDK